MSAVVVQDVAPPIEAASAAEVDWAACACCGLRERCTAAYAAGVRAQFAGQWLCGLCGDAVGEELAGCGVGGGGSASATAEVRQPSRGTPPSAGRLPQRPSGSSRQCGGCSAARAGGRPRPWWCWSSKTPEPEADRRSVRSS
ncbi:hypothetical protein ZWY2020_034738 [Hordeum vulgare]|nr:hypothetical protein ZWY2020_034738 [Hordeum vulgare]